MEWSSESEDKIFHWQLDHRSNMVLFEAFRTVPQDLGTEKELLIRFLWFLFVLEQKTLVDPMPSLMSKNISG